MANSNLRLIIICSFNHQTKNNLFVEEKTYIIFQIQNDMIYIPTSQKGLVTKH